MKPMHLPNGAIYIIDRLFSFGERADVVGGCVRDHIMCRTSGDYDITTSATPDKVSEIFSDARIINTGIKHGTVTIVLDDGSYEVTTYRLDGEYLDNRHPTEVIFTEDLSLDLQRRDFTINAMCYNPRDGFTDIYGGIDDINLGIVRAVGNPEERFTEDALRIMRALRFSAVLNFRLEEKTERAARRLRKLLDNVSRERIYVEVKKLIHGDGAYRVLRDYGDILVAAIPALSAISLPDERRFLDADDTARLLSIFYLSADNPKESFVRAMHSLKTDNAIRELGAKVLDNYLLEPLLTVRDALRLLAIVGEEPALEVIRLGILLGDQTEEALDILRSAIEARLPYRIADLKIDGKALMSLGAKGKEIGLVLSRLIEAVIEGECQNTENDLISLAKTMLSE